AFSGIGIKNRTMARLGEETVRRILMRHTASTQRHLRVLELPFFLNAALTLSYFLPELPSTESEFLEALWNVNYKEPRIQMPRKLAFEPLLMRMAEIQLATMSYEVLFFQAEAGIRDMTDANDALARLQSVGIIWRQTRAGELTVRLTHDLLDCYSVARL